MNDLPGRPSGASPLDVAAGHIVELGTSKTGVSDVKAQLLDILGVMGKAPKHLPDYYTRLIHHQDPYLRVGGLAALLDLGALPREDWELAVASSSYGAVARRAFNFFDERYEYRLAERVVAAFAGTAKPDITMFMSARLNLDSRAEADFEVRQFLENGEVAHLIAAADKYETAAGWREAVAWSARATALHPIVPNTAGFLLQLLESANQYDIIDSILAIFKNGDVFPLVRRVFLGSLLLKQGKPRDAISHLALINLASIPGAHLRSKIFGYFAEAHEALGDYREAAGYYRHRNEQQDEKKIDPAAFMKGVRRLERIKVGELDDDLNSNYYMMIGFPRSGTTLLENAFAAHPEVETFEEIPSLQAVSDQINQIEGSGTHDPTERRVAFEAARERYYVEINRRRRNNAARVFIDKLPIRSAFIVTMERLFPKKKYIFSIRHPYDVVLSCYKQSFKPNPAMENFRYFDKACALYDQVMSIWFGVFPGENERLCYIRYDDLVMNFERELRRAFAFLGVEWDDEVNEFAEKSELRRVATPSYAKVRAGLSIGVQSSWQNYKFLFETKEAAVLNKWVDRFGYQR